MAPAICFVVFLHETMVDGGLGTVKGEWKILTQR